MSKQDRFKDKIVFITGASRGIGRKIAEHYLESGAQVIGCARHQPKEALCVGKHTVDFIAADIRDIDVIKSIFVQIEKKYKRLDIVINNAGGGPLLAVEESTPRLLESIIRLNLTVPLWVSQEAYRLMSKQETGGHIVNIASLAGLRAAPNTAAYGAAKAGLINLTRSLAIEWGPKIKVNALAPGMTLHEDTAKYYGGKKAIARFERLIAAGRFAQSEDIANACSFLTSPEASYLSGVVLEVHGGGELPAFNLLQE